MTLNAVIYGSLVAQLPLWLICNFAKGASHLQKVSDDGSWINIKLEWTDLKIRLVQRNFWQDENLINELNQLKNYSRSKWSGGSGASLFRLVNRIGRTRQAINVIAEPGIDKEGRIETLIFSIANSCYGIVFYNGNLYGTNANVLLDKNRAVQGMIEFKHPESSSERRKRTIEFFQRTDLRIFEEMELIEGEEEAVGVDEQDVVQRCLTLRHLAEIDLRENPGVGEIEHSCPDLTEREKSILLNRNMENDFSRLSLCWESLFVLLWSIGVFDDLVLPFSPVNIGEIKDRMDRSLILDQSDHIISRDIGELLDLRDILEQCFWSSNESRRQQSENHINNAVITERLRAIRWLTYYQYAEWDDVI